MPVRLAGIIIFAKGYEAIRKKYFYCHVVLLSLSGSKKSE
jgi:hypothetical protein